MRAPCKPQRAPLWQPCLLPNHPAPAAAEPHPQPFTPPRPLARRPPELITDGFLTTAADVYAFGVLAWEVFAGRRAWDGYKPAEVLRKVANRGRLPFPPNTPHRLKVGWGVDVLAGQGVWIHWQGEGRVL